MNIKHIIVLLSIAALTACSENEGLEGKQQTIPSGTDDTEDLVPVLFSVSGVRNIDFTRASTNIVTFNSGETIKVLVKPNGATSHSGYDYITASGGQNNVPLTAPALPPYYPPGLGTTVEAYAYYPSTAGTTFTVETDQTSDADYKKSDLMYAVNRIITKGSSDGNDNLTMEHQMAQLAITAQAQAGSGLTISRVEVEALKSVTFDPDPSAASRVTATGVAGTITALNAAGTGYIVIPPQVINGVIVRVITGTGTADEIATYAFTGITGNFVSGASYNINLTVSPDQLGLTSSISNWNGLGSVNVTPSGNLTILAITAQEYTGSAITPGFTVYRDGAIFDPDNYKVTWVNNVESGTAYIIVTGLNKGTGADYSTCVGLASFTITPAYGKIDYPDKTVTKTYGNAPFTNPLSNYDIRDGDIVGGRKADGPVTYVSSNPSVATVDENTGEVTIIKAGTAIITATATSGANYVYSTTDGNHTSSYTLTVNNAAGSISFGYPNPIVTWNSTPANNKFDTQILNHTGDATVTYSVPATTDAQNTCGASVNSSTGVVTFTKSGSVAVTATVADTDCYTYASKTATYTLTVNKATGYITISPTSGTVDAGTSISFSVTNSHGGALTAADISGNGRATPTISGTTINVATTSGGGSSATIQVTCAANEYYSSATANYSLTINAASDIMRNPLWYMAKTNCGSATSFVNYETTVDARGVKFTWATALSYFTTASGSITGYQRGEKTMTGGLNNYSGDTWHMPTLQEWLSIYGYKGGRYSSGNSLFRNTIPTANTVVTEDECVFGYNSATKISQSYKAYWGTYTNNSNLRYAIRFLGTPYCSIWKYQLDTSNKLCIVSAKLIDQINENETGKLQTMMSNMGSVDWSENESTGTIQRYIYWAGYDGDITYGHFWVATEDNGSDAYNMLFLDNWLGQSDLNTKTSAMSVRLFRDN